MTSTKTVKMAAALASCSTGVFLAVMATASPAGADPVDPGVPVTPAPGVPTAAANSAPPAVTVQSAGTDVAPLPPNGIQHLASPDALPPGSTMDPQSEDSPNVGYLKDLWQAVQNHEISGKEALVMGFAQRGMNTPYPDQAPGPNVPITPADAPPPPVPGGPAPDVPAPPTP